MFSPGVCVRFCVVHGVCADDLTMKDCGTHTIFCRNIGGDI